MDLKKEIKLSDLFKRKPKAPRAEAPEAATAAPEAKRERASFLKRDLSLTRRRRTKDPDFDVGPKKSRRAKKGLGRRRGEGENAVSAVPAIPLMRGFNLMPTEDARQAAGRRPSTVQLVLAVAALVVLAGLGSVFLVANASVADKEREYNALVEELAAKQVPLEQPKAVGGTDAGLVQERDGRTGALAAALGSRIAWDRLLRDVSLVLPDDVWLKGLTGTSAAAPVTGTGAPPPDPNAAAASTSTFEVVGYTRRHEGVAQFLSRLSVLPEIQSASLVSATVTKVAKQDVVEFTLRATVKPHSPGGGA
jgi:Tfp pilus assembly protein PilN